MKEEKICDDYEITWVDMKGNLCVGEALRLPRNRFSTEHEYAVAKYPDGFIHYIRPKDITFIRCIDYPETEQRKESPGILNWIMRTFFKRFAA